MSKRKTIPKTIRIMVWEKEQGQQYHGKCHCCATIIDVNKWEVGHKISVKNGGTTTVDNLVCLCQSCNRSMGSQNLVEFMNQYMNKCKTALDSHKQKLPLIQLLEEEEARRIKTLNSLSKKTLQF